MKAVAWSVDISPIEPVELGAAHVGDSPWVGIVESIEANFLALWDDVAASEPVLVVTFDLLYPGAELRDAIIAAARLPPDRVLVAASHNHRAPMTDHSKPKLGRPNADYFNWLTVRLRESIRQNLRPDTARTVVLNASVSKAHHSINRRRRKLVFISRRPRFNAIIGAPNPRGVTDETVLTVTIRDATGRALAVLWNYACHPVGYPVRNGVSGHFPYVVRRSLRQDEHNDTLPVLYFQGFSGNTRPRATARVHGFANRIRRILGGPIFQSMTQRTYHQWSASLSEVVLQSIGDELVIDSDLIEVARIERPGLEFARGLVHPVSFQVLKIGRQVAIVGMSGELVAEYAQVVRDLSHAPITLLVGCIDQTFGYVPTREIMAQGGYEAGEFLSQFDLEALNPEIERLTVQTFSQLLS